MGAAEPDMKLGKRGKKKEELLQLTLPVPCLQTSKERGGEGVRKEGD